MAEERNAAFLERCLDRRDQAWRWLSRTGLVALMMMLVVQGVVLPRFVDLSQQLSEEERLHSQRENDLNWLAQFTEQTEATQEVLQSGVDRLRRELNKVVPTLQKQLDRFSREVNALRKERSGGGTESETGIAGLEERRGAGLPFTAQQPDLRALLEPPQSYWDDLTPGGVSTRDREILQESGLDDAAFRKVVDRLIETSFVKPPFTSLQRVRSELLGRFETKKAAIEKFVDRSGDGEQGALGQEVQSAMKASLEALAGVQQELEQLDFSHPEYSRWWKSESGKEQQVATMKVDAMQVSHDTLSITADLVKDLATRSRTLRELQEQASQRRQGIETSLEEIDEHMNELTAMLGVYGKALPVVGVQAKDIFLVYPMGVLLFGAYFISRASWLLYQDCQLERLLTGSGINKESAALYLANPIGGSASNGSAVRRRWPVVVILLAGSLAGLAIQAAMMNERIPETLVLNPVHQFLSWGAGLVLLLSVAVAFQTARASGSRSS